MQLGGYAGKILYVDLTTGNIRKEPLDPKLAEDFIGGHGINMRLGYNLFKPGRDAYAPDNPIIIGAGFLNGTVSPGSSKVIALHKDPISGAITLATGGSRLGPMLKWAGYDHVVITGKAEKPVYLKIIDDDVEICDAKGVWGKEISQANAELRRRHGQGCTVYCMGPAGENLANIAIALIDGISHLGRAIGGCMGSKNLKAMVVYGTKGVRIADRERFMKAVDGLAERAMRDPLRKGWASLSLNFVSEPWLRAGHKKAQVGTEVLSIEEYLKLYGPEEYLRIKKRAIGCPACYAGDKALLEVREGEYKGLLVCISTPDIETGVWWGIKDKNKGLKLMSMFNELGIDYVNFQGIFDWVIELYERGILTKEDTGGLELRRYGDFDLYKKLIEMTAHREGLGDLMADGIIKAIKRIGRRSEKYAYHIKGCTPDFDARNSLGVETFGSVVSPRPSYDMPIGGLSVAKGRKPDFMKRVAPRMGFPPEVVEQIVTPTGWDLGRYQAYYENWGMVFDSLGICFRMQNSAINNNPPLQAELYSAATGKETTPEQLVKAGERTYNLWRAANAREGFSRKDDKFPERWFEPINGNYEDKQLTNWMRDYFDVAPVSREDTEKMLDAFYKEKGWDISTGIPTPQKLRELGLDDAAKDLEKLKL